MAAVQELPDTLLGRVELDVAWETRDAATAFVASLQTPPRRRDRGA